MTSDNLPKAIRYAGKAIADAIRDFSATYRNVNDRVYGDWNEASKIVGDVGRDQSADYADASHKQGKSRTYRHSKLMEREEQLALQSKGEHVADTD